MGCGKVPSCLVSFFASLAASGIAAAAAPPVVYHSPAMNGDNPGTPYDITNVTDTLDLWYRPGATSTATGTACLDGDGDEICGITVEIQASGAVTLDNFSEHVASDLVYNFSPPTLTINRLNGTDGDDADVAIRLGSLDVSAGIGTGDISLVAGESEATGAALQTLAVNDNGMIAVPEPRVVIGLAVAALVLVGLTRHRLGLRA